MGMTKRRGVGSLLGVSVLTVAIMLVGCSPITPDSSATQVVPEQSVVEPEQGAVGGSMSGYPTTYTPEAATKKAKRAFRGTVVEVLPATWNTVDRKQPAFSAGKEPDGALIYTPVRVRIDRSYKGNNEQFCVVKFFGGQIGDQIMTSDNFGDIPSVGDQMAVLVDYDYTEKNGDVLGIPVDVYVISEDGVQSQSDRRANYSLDGFERRLEAAAR